MNDETSGSEALVFKFSGEILVDGRQIELLLKKGLTNSQPPYRTAPASIPSPAKASSLERRMTFGVRETAGLLGVSQKTVYRLVQRGLIRASRALRHIKIPKAEIERFLKASAD
jgi:excisionase family DNA binding protein